MPVTKLEDRLQISLIPPRSARSASSRIRVYTLARALRRRGVQVSLHYSPKADVVLVHKGVSLITLQMVRLARLRNQAIIYDVDDLGYALWQKISSTRLHSMIQLTDMVTTATVAQLEHIHVHYPQVPGRVLPCSIDYYPQQPERSPPSISHPLRLLWFGNTGNIVLLNKYARVLDDIGDSEVVVCTNTRKVRAYARKYPRFSFVRWSLSTFIDTLQSCHISCLMHDGSIWDRAKSNNKMTTSITWGVPAVVSDTPDYLKTAREAGVESAVFASEAELISIIERLRSEKTRQEYLDIAQPRIWDLYSPDAIAASFLQIVDELLDTKPERTVEQRLKTIRTTFRSQPSPLET